METLEELKAIIAGKPEGATHIASSVGQSRYLKHNIRRDFVYYDGRTFCSFPSRSGYLRVCKSIRELSDIERIIELMEVVEDAAALGFLTPSFDSGVSHKALCKKYKAMK